jgi:hypothetical protein
MPMIVPPGRNPVIDAAWAGLQSQRKAEAEKPVAVGADVFHPKQNVCTSGAYMAAARNLGFCVRCGFVQPSDRKGLIQFCHADQGKGAAIKTDVRRGWAGCGPHDGMPGCHWEVGTSGQLSKANRRAEEDRLGELTRRELRRRGLWPKSVPSWPGDEPKTVKKRRR